MEILRSVTPIIEKVSVDEAYLDLSASFSHHGEVDAALAAAGCDETALPAETRSRNYAECLAEARSWAERLGEPCEPAAGPELEQFGELKFFNVG